MSDVPVRQLTITHSQLSNPVTVDLPWDGFPAGAQTELDRLDADDSGILVYSPETAPGQLQELTHANRSSVTFRRLFWAYNDEPYFTDPQNDSTQAARQTRVRQIQDTIFNQVILGRTPGSDQEVPLIADPENEQQWFEAGRILETLSDSRHLYEMARYAWGYWEARQDPKFLRIAERYLLEAKRIEAAYPSSTSTLFDEINLLLGHVDLALDRIDNRLHGQQRRSPYLMASMEAPATVNLREGQSNYEVAIRVAVPAGMSEEEVAAYFRSHQLTARPSAFQGYQPTGEDVSLSFVRVISEQDAASNARDYSSIIFEPNVNTLLFGGNRSYVQVVFSLPNAREALGNRDVRRFDLRFNGSGTNERVMPGSFVIQDLEGETVRILFAADTHLSERDYEVARVMIQSIRGSSGETVDPVLVEQYADRIERFYGYFNENAEVMVEEFNERYRRGECHRVVIAGDFVEFINIAADLQDHGYRGTNVRRLFHILSKLEAPLLMKPGNHDLHIAPHPHSQRADGFPYDTALQDLYAVHYDRHIFGTTNPIELGLRAIEGLLTRRCEVSEYGHTDCIVEVMRELMAENPFGASREEGLGPYMRIFGTNDADLTYMGNNLFLFQWKTNEEHFNQQRWMYEELSEPVGLNLIKGAGIYLNDRHVNSKGPRPDTALYFIRSVAMAQRVGGNMVVAQHYPAFYLGTSAADQTPDAADALRCMPNWTLRLASYHFRHADGSPVVDVVVSGHVHKWGEYDFSFDSFEQEEQFRREVGELFDGVLAGSVSGDQLYMRVHDLRVRYDLADRIITRRVIGTGPTNPGPIVSEFNRNSLTYGRERGTLFVNSPGAGTMSSGSPNGYMMMTIQPNGRMEITPHFYFREPDGTILSGTGNELPQMRQTHADRVVQWKRSIGMEVPDIEIPTGAPHMSISGPREIKHWTIDPLPLICQYPKGKVCLAVGAGGAWDIGRQRLGYTLTPLLLTIPLTDRYHGYWGLNYLRFGIDYSSVSDWSMRLGVGLGVVDPYVFSGFNFGGGANQHYGLALQFFGQSAMAIPAIEPWVSIREDGNEWRGGIGLRWRWDWISVQP